MEITRRRALVLAASSGALAAATPGCTLGRPQDEERDSAGLRFGLAARTWGADLEISELVSTCEAAGLDGVELGPNRHGIGLLTSKAERAEVRARFADRPVEFLGIDSGERLDSPEPNGLASAVELVRLYLELSRDVGGSGVLVRPGSFHEGVPRERTVAQFASGLEQLAPRAEALGQELRLEVHGTCGELPTLRAILDLAPHAAVRVCWGSIPTDLTGEGLAQTLHVRRFDDASYPWGELLRLLKESAYTGYVLLEPGGVLPPDLVAALTEQRRLFETLSEESER